MFWASGSPDQWPPGPGLALTIKVNRMIHPATIGAVIAIIVMAGLLITNAAKAHPQDLAEDCQQAAPPAYITTLQQRSITP